MRYLFIFLIPALLVGCKSSESAESQPEPTPTESTESIVVDGSLWQEMPANEVEAADKLIEPKDFKLYKLDYDKMMQQLDASENVVITIPSVDGMLEFTLTNSNTMSPELAAKFPEIRSFKGESKNSDHKLRLDTNEKGLYAEITSTEETQLIAPYVKEMKTYYVLYLKSNLENTNPRDKSFE